MKSISWLRDFFLCVYVFNENETRFSNVKHEEFNFCKKVFFLIWKPLFALKSISRTREQSRNTMFVSQLLRFHFPFSLSLSHLSRFIYTDSQRSQIIVRALEDLGSGRIIDGAQSLFPTLSFIFPKRNPYPCKCSPPFLLRFHSCRIMSVKFRIFKI